MQRAGLEIRHFEAIVALADELSYTRASRRVGITQSGLTRRIQDAEVRLGHQLFKRDRASVELTDAGCAFVAEAKLAIEHEQRAVRFTHAAVHGIDAALTIGRSQYAEATLVELLLSTHLPLHPNLNIDLRSEFAPELEQGVLAGRLDLALITCPGDNPRLSSLKVAEAPMYCLLPEDDYRRSLASVELEALTHDRWIVFDRRIHPGLYDTLFSMAQQHGVRPKAMHHVMSAEEAALLVGRGKSVAFLSKAGALRVAKHGLAAKPISHAELTPSVHLVARADNGSKLVSEFVRNFAKRAKTVLQAPQMRLLDHLPSDPYRG